MYQLRLDIYLIQLNQVNHYVNEITLKDLVLFALRAMNL